MSLEKSIERRLCDEVKKIGGIPYKFTSPNRRSVPDRLCLFPTGIVCFVEVKSPGKPPTPQQGREIERIKRLGFAVHIVDSRKKVDQFIDIIRSLIDELRRST